MSLIINQGIQDTTNDNKREILVENNVMLEINNLELSKFKPNALNVTFRILNGKHQNKLLFETVDYDSASPGSWKYRSLRSCAGVPYKEGEPANIDIEELLKGKVIEADLGVRPGKDRDGNPTDYQKITYRKLKDPTPSQTATTPATATADDLPEIAPEDLPFKKAVVEEKVAQPTAKEEPKATVTVTDAEEWD